MDFDEFKDKTIASVIQGKLKERVLMGIPVYTLAHSSDGEVRKGNLDISSGDLFKYVEDIRRITSAMKYDFAAVGVYSMVADLSGIDNESGERDHIKSLSGEELMEHLENRDLLMKSITIRLEDNKSPEDNCMITFMLKDDEATDHVEILDEQLDDKQKKSSPFRGGLFD